MTETWVIFYYPEPEPDPNPWVLRDKPAGRTMLPVFTVDIDADQDEILRMLPIQEGRASAAETWYPRCSGAPRIRPEDLTAKARAFLERRAK